MARARGIGEFAPLGAITEEHFDKTFNANVKGLLFTVQKALPLLKDGSSIILNALIVSSTGSPALSVYCASKAAVRSFVHTFTTDLKDRKIRVNAVSPGVIPSPGYRNSLGMTEEQVKQNADSVVGKIPPGRTETLDEVAKVVSFLASEESSYVSGVETLRRRRHDPNLTSLTACVST
jgi:NAD(P)-dependent dehydrogenase (short-subunit alcohol dehydrogenase family)